MKQLIIAASIIVHFFRVETHYQYADGFGFDRTHICNDTGTIRITGKFTQTDSTVIQRKGVMTKTYWIIKNEASQK